MTHPRYRNSLAQSYSLGAFPTLELLQQKREYVQEILYHPQIKQELLQTLQAQGQDIPLREDLKSIQRNSPKENTWVMGVFEKYREELLPGAHLMLVEASNYGNLGTILRTALGFGIKDVALLGDCVDSFHPHVIRASMGARFALRLKHYKEWETYRQDFPEQAFFPLMTDASAHLHEVRSIPKNFTFVLGNESRGLDDVWKLRGQALSIPMEDSIDSLNLTIAAAIALYHFYLKTSRV